MKIASTLKVALISCGCALSWASLARADVVVSFGYYDLAPSCCGTYNPNALPSPWYGSTNTTFLGDTSLASSSDPDEAAILITNTGLSAVTLDSGFTVNYSGGSLQLWNSLIGVGGLSIPAGQNVILSATTNDNFDGSDIPLTDAVVDLTLNGHTYDISDISSILIGFGYPSSEDETLSWTRVDDINFSTTPLPAALPLFATGLGAMRLFGWRRKRKAAAASAA
jgi:hypothetical protein